MGIFLQAIVLEETEIEYHFDLNLVLLESYKAKINDIIWIQFS